MTYWIVVGSEENMRIAKARGFDMFGFKSTRRSETAQMKPGDKLIFYLTKIMKFGGLAEITSDYFEDHAKVVKCEKKPGEDYPFHVKVKPLIVLEPDSTSTCWRSRRVWTTPRSGPRSTGASPSRQPPPDPGE
jgi:predicted RNA-binding protein